MIKEFLNTDSIAFKAAKIFSKLPISPNQWTILSVIPAIIGFYLAYTGLLSEAGLLFLIAGLMDGIDGGLARYLKKSTKLGAFMDGVIDRFIDFLLVFAFLFIGLPDFIFSITIWVVIQAYFALMPTFIVAYANHREAVIDPTEKVVWRILHRTEMYPLWIIALVVASFNPMWGTYIFVFTAVLSVITTFQSFILSVIKSKNYNQIV